jgi:phage-related protein
MTNKLYLISDDEGPIIWEVRFEPSTGERASVEDYIRGLPDTDVAVVFNHLKILRKLPAPNWPHWVKLIDKGLYQLTAHKHRLYFGISGNKIIFVYACRKVSQKAKAQDIARAKENLKKYVREDRDE